MTALQNAKISTEESYSRPKRKKYCTGTQQRFFSCARN